MAGFWLLIAIFGTIFFLILWRGFNKQRKPKKLKGKDEIGIIEKVIEEVIQKNV